MGERGPVPKRSDERIRRNATEVPVEKLEVIGSVQVPELGIDDPHPFIVDFYQSLIDSAQSRYYEPSDWQYARWLCFAMNDYISGRKPSAVMFQSINAALSDLLITEGERRRVRLEIERGQNGDTEGGTVTSFEDYMRKRLSQ
jgi:hypothetical protein